MHVAAVLKRKGTQVVSIAPDRTIAEAVSLLTNNGIGAVLVLGQHRVTSTASSRNATSSTASAGRVRTPSNPAG